MKTTFCIFYPHTMITITTTRFTDETFFENELYRKYHTDTACVYGSPQPMPPSIDHKSVLFVVEMNNTTNSVMGVGLIRNQPVITKRVKVYSTGNFNRFVFKGKYRVDRSEMSQDLVDVLETLLFTGKTHMKRGAGFTSITPKLLGHPSCEKRELKKEIYLLFKSKYVDV